MRSFIYIAGLSLAFLWLLGCTRTQTHQAWSSVDSWFRPPNEWSRFRQAQSLPDSDISEVIPERMAAAEEQLHDVACVEISAELALSLLDGPYRHEQAAVCFLFERCI